MATECEMLVASLAEQFSCSEHEGYVRVRTPFVYPDGDAIDLYLKRPASGAAIEVSDLGETLRWLRMQTTAQKRSPRQQKILENVCRTHGVEVAGGVLRCQAADDRGLADAVIRVSQAAARVADVWFTYRSRAFSSFADDVAEFLSERGITYERDDRRPGKSGRIYRFDFHVRATARDSLVSLLATGSRAAARPAVEHVFTAFADVLPGDGFQPVALFDDTADVWAPEDFKLLEIATVARWSAPDEFVSALLVAA